MSANARPIASSLISPAVRCGSGSDASTVLHASSSSQTFQVSRRAACKQVRDVRIEHGTGAPGDHVACRLDVGCVGQRDPYVRY